MISAREKRAAEVVLEGSRDPWKHVWAGIRAGRNTS